MIITRTTDQGQITDDSISRDLDAAYDAINRQDAQLDSFNTKLSILAKGIATFSWDGTVAGGNTSANATVAHTLGYAPIFVAFYKWSGDPAGQWRPLSDLRFDTTGTATWQVQAYTTSTNFFAYMTVAQAGSASTFTVAYFFLKEPAQAS